MREKEGNAMSDHSQSLKVSAIYVCPLKGLVDLRPPVPKRLGQAAAVAKSLGVERLYLPVLEESLFLPAREKIAFLDGLLQALDQLENSRMDAWLILPAQKILGLTWIIPDLAKSLMEPDAEPVFVAGQVRKLRPFGWWADPSIIQKRLRAFREALSAVAGHPGLKGLFILDRGLEWPRPTAEAALFVIKALKEEVGEREREGCRVGMGFGWRDLLEPALAERVSKEVERLRIGGIDTPPRGMDAPGNLAEEILLAAFMGTMASWLFRRATEVEVGWNVSREGGDALTEACERFRRQGMEGMAWLSLVDPEPPARQAPPWVLRPDLSKVGLLDHHLDPKPWAEECVKRIRGSEPSEKAFDFIDISKEEYLREPGIHVLRLWEHFKGTG
jgi:hypothetical protein